MKTKAIYSGSFDPIHNGHLDIIRRAAQLFNLEVVVADNSMKKYALGFRQRLALVNNAIGPLPVPVNPLPPGMLLADYAQLRGVPLIVKGVRGFNDFDYERALHEISVSQQSGVQTVLLPGLSSMQHISSTAVKELVKLHADLQYYAPKAVIVELQRSLNQQYILGVTGGIGCGKSTLCKYLEKFPPLPGYSDVAHIDLDKVVARLYDNTHELAIDMMFREVGARLGLAKDCGIGELRKAIAHEIFVLHNTEFQHWFSQQLLPFAMIQLRSDLLHRRAAMQGKAGTQLVLLESALLAQEGLLHLCNNNVWQVVIGADDQVRRLTAHRNFEESAATARMMAQWTEERTTRHIKATIAEEGYGSCRVINSSTDIPLTTDTVQMVEAKRTRLHQYLTD